MAKRSAMGRPSQAYLASLRKRKAAILQQIDALTSLVHEYQRLETEARHIDALLMLKGAQTARSPQRKG